MKEKLSIKKIQKSMDFILGIPKRMERENRKGSTITLEYKYGEMQYIPRKNTFMRNTSLTSEELRAIADKIDMLNK